MLHAASRPARPLAAARRRGRSARAAAPGGGDGGGEEASLSDSDLAGLAARVAALRQREVDADRAVARNWSRGVAKTGIARLPDWARRLALHGDKVLVGTYGGKVHLLDGAASFARLRSLEGLGGETTALAFDGSAAAAGCRTGVVCRWCAESGAGGKIGRMDGAVTAVALLPDGRVLAASDGGVVRCFGGGAEAPPPPPPLQASQPVRCLARCGRYVALGLEDGTCEIFASEGERFVRILSFAAHSAAVLCLQFLSEGEGEEASALYSGGADGAVHSWSLSSGESLLRIAGAHKAAVTCLQADRSKVVTGGRDGSVRVWDAATGSRRFSLQPFTPYLDGLAFSGPMLVTTGVNDAISVSTFDC